MVNSLPNLGRGLPASRPAGGFAPDEVLSRLGPLLQASAELRALSRERDPELFYQALLSHAGRLERQGHSAESQAILEIVTAGASEASVAGRARSRLQALQGTGAIGARAEVLLGRLSQEVTEPAALFAMGGAGAIYRLSRFAMLARLGSAPVGLLTRGIGGRALASTLAFTAEATSFPLLARTGNFALGRSQQWSTEQLSREIAASFFALGGLRLAGAGAAALQGRLGQGNAAAWLGPVFRQTAMFGGILAGHRMEEWAGLRPTVDGATTAIDGLALLLQFNMAGRLSQRLFGEGFQAWEREIDRHSEILGSTPRPSLGDGLGPLAVPAYAMASAPRGWPTTPLQFEPALMEGNNFGSGSGRASGLPLPKMGIRGGRETSNLSERLNRQEAERVLRELISEGLNPRRLEQPGLVENLLNAFAIPAHPFDVRAFRQGYRIAQRHAERVGRLAFDFDEVALHWAFGPRDLLSVMASGAEAAYYHTPTRALDYEPLPAGEGQGLNRFERIWFQGIQRLLPMAFRQHVQFHPGMRALQLGMRLAQDRNLIMVTVGQPGRLMRLANEDPALKMIYFGRLPMDELSIGDVRGATNIYTREDIVQALRAAESGDIRFPNNPVIESYLETLRQHPESGDRLKHPALALLRGKRPFDGLVDDSSFPLEALGSLPGFSVFQVPSARPARTKNFTLGSTDAYLLRSANGYVDALADLLLQDTWASGPIENRPAPENYPYQRLSIEIPWTKFGTGYVALGKEARARGRALAEGREPAAIPAGVESAPGPLSLSESQTRTMVERLHREFDILLDGRLGEVSIEAANTLMFKEMAASSPENFQASLDTYFTPEEQATLPQASRPLAERGDEFYSRAASLVAVKTAVCNLLALDVAEHAREIHFRFGRPLLSGVAAHRLNGNSMLTSLSDEGEVGIGIALLEPSQWTSGLVGIGVDLTTQARSANPERHALASAAFKAAYPAHIQREFNDERSAELVADPSGGYSLTGASLLAARSIRGDNRIYGSLPIRTLSFQIGRATVGLAAIPALDSGGPRPAFTPRPLNLPYRIDEDGRFQLPRPGMTVAVLGDVQATRTLELVRKGHYVVHIERDPDMAELAEQMVRRFIRDEGPTIGTAADNSVVRADWYDSATNADFVEAYFPLHAGDIPRRGQPGRQEALRDFLDLALNSKLVNGGSGYVVSEMREIVEDLAEVIEANSRLQLIDARYNRLRAPISGGFSTTMDRRERVHYLIYRKEGE